MEVIFISVMILHPWSHTKISSERYRNAGAGTALLLAVAVFDGPSSATTCFGLARRRNDKSQTGLRTGALMMHEGGVLYHTVNTCQHIISISLCVSLHVCSHGSHLRWNQDMMQCKAGFFRRIRRRFFMQIQLLLIWFGLDVFPNLLVMLCRSWLVMVRLRLYGSWAFVGKKHCWLSEASFLTSTPVL